VTPSAEQLDEMKHEQKPMLDEAIAEINERRDAINQIKGILMLIYCFSAETAFSVLR
jgi:AmiR/NasT family two-component response regulator